MKFRFTMIVVTHAGMRWLILRYLNLDSKLEYWSINYCLPRVISFHDWPTILIDTVTKRTNIYTVNVIEMSTAKEVKCEICGTTFITQQDKEEHKKLEHKEHREPSGIS